MLEAPSRFELESKGFADLRLTTWLWRRLACSPRLVIITLLRSFPCSPFSVPLSRQNPQVLEEKEGLRSGVRRRGLPPATNEAQPIPTWSGRRDSDSRPQPWQGCALPTELLPRKTAPCGGVVRTKRLELLRPEAPDPKSGASAIPPRPRLVPPLQRMVTHPRLERGTP